MKTLKILCGTAVLFTVMMFSGHSFAQDGAKLYAAKACLACHGADAKSPITDVIPKLAGQNKGYLVQQLKDIKSGARANGGTAQMKSIAAGLSDEDISAIAEYLSKL